MKDKVNFKTSVDGTEVELTTIAPNARISNEADVVRASAFFRAMKPTKDREAVPSRAEIEKGILPEHDLLWGKDKEEKYKETHLRLLRNEKRLKGGGMKKSEGASLAWSMKEDRDTLMGLQWDRNRLNENSAEHFADMARLNFLVYSCTLRDGRPFYASLDDYYMRANEQYSVDAATSLLKLINDFDDDVVNTTPEYNFLFSYGFVDKDYRRINEDGRWVDENGKLVNEKGQLIDDQGNVLDIDGDKLTEDGEFDVVFSPFTDDDGNDIEPKG
jgi:hypothetical protein